MKMRWLIAIGLTFTLAAGAARAATPAEIACTSYRTALAGETNAGRRAAMLKSVPQGCEARTQSPKLAVATKRRVPLTPSPAIPPPVSPAVRLAIPILDPEFCRDYAQVAVEQARNCFASSACRSQDQNDGVWSTDFQHHYDWCVGVSYSEAGLGRDQRTEILVQHR